MQVSRSVYGVILFQTLVYQMTWGSFASWVSIKPVSSSRNNLLVIPHLPQTFTIAYKIWRELKNNIDDYRLKVGPDWDRELKFGGWAGGWAEKIQAYWERSKDSNKTLILLKKVWWRGQDLNLRPSGYEPVRHLVPLLSQNYSYFWYYVVIKQNWLFSVVRSSQKDTHLLLCRWGQWWGQ